MDLERPPPDSKVAFRRSDDPIAPGWVSLEGTFANQLGQTFRVRVSAEKEYLRTLQEYAESLHIWMEVTPDIPELEEYLAKLTALASKQGDSTIKGTINRVRRENPNGPRIVLETNVASVGNSVVWAATWSWQRKDSSIAWHGQKWAKMQVATGRADLQGVSGGAAAVRAPGETDWKDAPWHCSVRGLDAQNQTRLNAGWIRD
ncbi:MAG TPA: hypothetical protein VF526_19635 [Solirubrobacteraceae bacterium]